MQVTVNGQSRQVSEGTSVAGLLEELRLTEKPVAVEINLELVPRQRHAQRAVEDDRLEIVTLVGGG